MSIRHYTDKNFNMSAYDLYHKLMTQDADLLTLLAQSAIRSAAETQSDIASDMQEDGQISVPDVNGIRDFAEQYTVDMLKDMQEVLVKKIKEVQFSVKAKVTLNIN